MNNKLANCVLLYLFNERTCKAIPQKNYLRVGVSDSIINVTHVLKHKFIIFKSVTKIRPLEIISIVDSILH